MRLMRQNQINLNFEAVTFSYEGLYSDLLKATEGKEKDVKHELGDDRKKYDPLRKAQ
jgi:hypothetical protein